MSQTKAWVLSLLKLITSKPPPFSALFDELVYGKAFDCLDDGSKEKAVLYFNEDIPQILVACVEGEQEYFNLRETKILRFSTNHQLQYNLAQNSYVVIKQENKELILLYSPQMDKERQTFLEFFKFYLAQLAKSPLEIESLLLYTFIMVDHNKNMTLSNSEMHSLLNNRLRIKENEYFQSVREYVHRQQKFNQGQITFSQFQKIMKLMQCRLEFKLLFQNISMKKIKSPKYYMQKLMPMSNFINFLRVEQGQGKQAVRIAQGYFDKQQALSFYDFSRFMTSNYTNAYNRALESYEQDTTLPLTSYYCYSSHNTYLTGNQFSSDSKAIRYRHDLQNGYRCLEIDIHNGDKEPIVKHGFTMTSSVTFSDVIKTIAKFSQQNPKHTPIILSFQNHTNLQQQNQMASTLMQELGDKILRIEERIKEKAFPSFQQCLGKIIIKGKGTFLKYQSVYESQNSATIILQQNEQQPQEQDPTTQKQIIEDCPADIRQAYIQFGPIKASLLKKKAKFNQSQKVFKSLAGRTAQQELPDAKQKISSKLLKLTAILAGGILKNPSIWECISFSENSVEKHFQNEHLLVKQWTDCCWARAYPSARRLDSSNFNPLPALELGMQMVALNSQSVDHYTAAMALFFRTGRLKTPGYRIKSYKDLFEDLTFKITPISCYMMTPLKDSNTIPSVQVKMQFLGCSRGTMVGNSSYTAMQPYTECIKDNAYNPIFQNTKVMKIKVSKPELAFILIEVPECGIAVISLQGLRKGYRSVALLDNTLQERSSRILFKVD